jgi:hypothetical protein
MMFYKICCLESLRDLMTWLYNLDTSNLQQSNVGPLSNYPAMKSYMACEGLLTIAIDGDE